MIEGGIIDSELRKIGTKYNADFRQESLSIRLPQLNIIPLTCYSFSGIDDALSLSFKNVTFAFAILAFGLIAALVQVVIEFMLRGLKIRGPNSAANPDGLFKVVDNSQKLNY